MTVTRADKATEMHELEAAFRGSASAILVDYKGLNVPEVTELRRQVRAARAQYRVVKNTLAKRAIKGTAFEVLDPHFKGTTALAYSGDDPVARPRSSTWPRSRASPSSARSCCSCFRRRWCNW